MPQTQVLAGKRLAAAGFRGVAGTGKEAQDATLVVIEKWAKTWPDSKWSKPIDRAATPEETAENRGWHSDEHRSVRHYKTFKGVDDR